MADITETPGQAVVSVTTTVPHAADGSSAPGPYEDLSPDRPPVSTTQPDVPIAHSLVAGAGEGNQNVQEETPAEEPAAAPATAKTAKGES